jgi:hypothetical protein
VHLGCHLKTGRDTTKGKQFKEIHLRGRDKLSRVLPWSKAPRAVCPEPVVLRLSGACEWALTAAPRCPMSPLPVCGIRVRTMGARIWTFVLLVGAGACATIGTQATPAGNALAEIEKEGPKVTLDRWFRDNERWERIFEGIASADSEWLAVAARLRSVSDAGASETLDMALQRALQRTPAAVLVLVGPSSFSVLDVCGGSGEAFEDPRPVSEIIKLVVEGRKRVVAITDPVLTRQRDECLAQIDVVVTRLALSERP